MSYFAAGSGMHAPVNGEISTVPQYPDAHSLLSEHSLPSGFVSANGASPPHPISAPTVNANAISLMRRSIPQ